MTEDRGLVAITGANGTIGYHSVLYALRTRYRVRCIIRRPDAIETIKAGPSVQHFGDKIEYAVVPDNTIPNAYDEAIVGAKYVVHIAGVWPMPTYHPDNDIYYPFVKSMENILSASTKAGTVRRVVFTQAGAALVNPDDGDTLGTNMTEILDEYVSINPTSASFRPPLPSPHHAYCGAKAHCMTHLHSLRSSNPETKPSFSIVQIIPGTVIGASELATNSSSAYAQMDRMSRALLFNEPKPRYAFGFVHVDDCATVHIESLDEGKVPDDQIPDWFVAAASTEERKTAEEIWRAVGEGIEKKFGKEVGDGTFKVGWERLPINMPFRVDSKRTEELLFRQTGFRSLGSCIGEVAGWYVELLERERNERG